MCSRQAEDRRNKILAERAARDDQLLVKASKLQQMREHARRTAAARKAKEVRPVATLLDLPQQLVRGPDASCGAPRQEAAAEAAKKAAQERRERGAVDIAGRLEGKRASRAAQEEALAGQVKVRPTQHVRGGAGPPLR